MEGADGLSSSFVIGDRHVPYENDLRWQFEKPETGKPANGSAMEMSITEQTVNLRNAKKRAKGIIVSKTLCDSGLSTYSFVLVPCFLMLGTSPPLWGAHLRGIRQDDSRLRFRFVGPFPS